MRNLKCVASGLAFCLWLIATPMFLQAEVFPSSPLVRGVDPRNPEAVMSDDIRIVYLTSLARFPTVSDCLDATDEVRVRWEDMISSTDIEVCFAWIALEAGNQDEYIRYLENLGGNVFIMQINSSSMRMHGSRSDGTIISTSWSLREGDVADTLPKNLRGNQPVQFAHGMTVNSYVTQDFRVLSTFVGFTIN